MEQRAFLKKQIHLSFHRQHVQIVVDFRGNFPKKGDVTTHRLHCTICLDNYTG